jgi:hypothetical protein
LLQLGKFLRCCYPRKLCMTLSPPSSSTHDVVGCFPLPFGLQITYRQYLNKSIYNQRTDQHDLRTNDDFILPLPRIELFKRIPLYSLPQIWNDTGNIKLQHNRTTYRWGLREELLAELVINDKPN